MYHCLSFFLLEFLAIGRCKRFSLSSFTFCSSDNPF
uniref:Uncharacterized protein n=1 Tax=Schistosoma curassoni TaxID=6186 RepID=A0A183L269_9TREM